MTVTRSMAQAADMYYLESGTYTPYWDDLAVAVPADCKSAGSDLLACNGFKLDIYLSAERNIAACLNNGKMAWVHWLHNSTYPDRIECFAAQGDSFFEGICKSMNGTPNGTLSVNICGGVMSRFIIN